MTKRILFIAAALLMLSLSSGVAIAAETAVSETAPVATNPTADKTTAEADHLTDTTACDQAKVEGEQLAIDPAGKDVVLAGGACEACFATFQACFRGCGQTGGGISCKEGCAADMRLCCQQNGCCASHGCCPP